MRIVDGPLVFTRHWKICAQLNGYYFFFSVWLLLLLVARSRISWNKCGSNYADIQPPLMFTKAIEIDDALHLFDWKNYNFQFGFLNGNRNICLLIFFLFSTSRRTKQSCTWCEIVIDFRVFNFIWANLDWQVESETGKHKQVFHFSIGTCFLHCWGDGNATNYKWWSH